MKLITETLLKHFSEIGSQEEVDDPLVIAKFFNPCGSANWYATEYSPDTNICFGFVNGLVPGGDEWGYFSIAELEAIRVPPYGISIERDIHFKECRFSTIEIFGL